MNSLKFFTTSLGIIVFYFHTKNGSMVRKSNLCIVAQTATSLTIAPALVATLQRFIFTKTMVLKDKSGVRFVTLNSTLTKIDSQKPLPFVALTAPEYWNLSRVESTLSFTNVETLNALTIFIILKKLIENI